MTPVELRAEALRLDLVAQYVLADNLRSLADWMETHGITGESDGPTESDRREDARRTLEGATTAGPRAPLGVRGESSPDRTALDQAVPNGGTREAD